MPSQKKRWLMLLTAVFAWKTVRTDWIVTADCVFHDSDPTASDEYFTATYVPPVTPLFLPPRPQDIAPGATSWNHPAFFTAGGSGGPIAEPRLRIHWLLLLIKIAAATLSGLIFIPSPRRLRS